MTLACTHESPETNSRFAWCQRCEQWRAVVVEQVRKGYKRPVLLKRTGLFKALWLSVRG
jgi:hypothetical protein